MEVERFAVLSECTMRHKIPELPTHDPEFVVETLVLRIVQIQRRLILVAPFGPRQPGDIIAGGATAIQDRDVNEDVFGPAKESLNGGQGEPASLPPKIECWLDEDRAMLGRCLDDFVRARFGFGPPCVIKPEIEF